MTWRDRVLASLKHEEPDRVPIDLGGTWVSTIAIRAYEKLKKYLDIEADKIKIEDIDLVTQCVRRIDEQILTKFGVDVRSVYPKFPSRKCRIEENKNSFYYTDEWGVKHRMPKKSGFYYDMVDHPLKSAELKDLEEYPWPYPRKDDAWVNVLETFRKEAKDMYENTEFAIVADISGPGIFELSWFLRGMENFLVDLIANQKFAEALLDKILEIKIWLYEQYLDAVGEYVQIVTVGDDLAGQSGPLMNPGLYRRIIKPRQKELLEFIKKRTKAKVFFHSCGSINGFIEDFIEIGVDIINPVQVSAKDMDTNKLKRKYGDKLTFWGGGCDTQNILPFGSLEDIEEEVKRRIKDLAPGGGFVFNQVHEVQANVPPGNIVTMFEAAKTYGTYPLVI